MQVDERNRRGRSGEMNAWVHIVNLFMLPEMGVLRLGPPGTRRHAHVFILIAGVKPMLVQNWFGATLELVHQNYPYSGPWRTGNQNLLVGESCTLVISIIRVLRNVRT
jgi:hypothetical protein